MKVTPDTLGLVQIMLGSLLLLRTLQHHFLQARVSHLLATVCPVLHSRRGLGPVHRVGSRA